MGATASRRLIDLMAEAYRLRLLRGLEELLADCGHGLVAGVDEAGRGCLAGPVVAAAVVVDPRSLVLGVNDSKKLTAEERSRLAPLIRSLCVATSVCFQPASVIDRINILEATRRAMVEALLSLDVRPDCALVDGVALTSLPFPCLPMVRGDAFSFAVACASILAKTERDALMEGYESTYPGYGFASHKGYAVEEHRRAIAELGPTPIHRLTFRSVIPRAADEGLPMQGEIA